MAQISVSPILEPSRIDDNYESAPQPQATPRIPGDEVVRAPRADFTQDVSFVLRNLRIEGATAFGREQLLAGWSHAPGDTVTVAELDALASQIARTYADAGYALSFAFLPAQEIHEGSVTIRVVEGFVDEVVLAGPAATEGRLGESRAVLQRMADKIKASRPLRTADLERYLLLMNDLPGLAVTATLSPSPNAEGGSVLTLEVERDSVSGEIGYNSFLPRELKRNAVGAALSLNGYITGSDQLHLSTMHSLVPGAYSSVAARYTTGLGSDGLRLDLATSYSRTEPTEQVLADIDYVGRAVSARIKLSYPLIRSRERNLRLAAGFSLDNSEVDVLDTALQRDRLRTIDASATYDFVGPGRSVNLIRVGLSQGVDIFAAAGDSRANGSATYTVADFDLQSTVPLATVGRGQLSVFGSAFGQAAVGKSLLSAAECGFGGRRFGRAFDAGVATGDHCLLASAELRWTAPFDVSFSEKSVAVQLYGVLDWGMIRQRGALQPAEARSEYGASGGAGLRLSLSDLFDAEFEATHSLNTPASLFGDEGLRVTGSVSLRF